MRGYGMVRPSNLILTGVDAARPSASAAIVGTWYYASDTKAIYLCISATEWRVASAGMEEDKVSWGPFSSNVELYCSASVGTEPSFTAGTSGCIALWPSGTPSGSEHIFAFRDQGATRGWYLAQGIDTGDRCLYNWAVYGTTGVVSPAGQTTAATLNQVNTLAWTVTATGIKTSHNGGAIVETNFGAGTYAPPQAGDRIGIGASISPGASPHVSGSFIAIKTFSTVVSDANLRLFHATVASTFRIPTPAGATISFQLNGNQIQRGINRFVANGESFQIGNSATNSLKKVAR